MKRGLKWRLIALGLAVSLMGVLIVVATLTAERSARQARGRLSQVDSESFRIAERFKDRLREVNDKMRRYASFHEPAVWDEFLQASHGFQFWIAQQQAHASTGREKAVLDQMKAAFDDYLRRAADLHTTMESAGKTSVSLVDYNSFFEQSRLLLDLCQQLGMAHYESRNLLLAHASRTLTQLRLLVLVLLALLFLFGIALAGVVYRDLIAPLRLRLVETEALAERNEKLVSLGVLAAGVAHEVRNPLTAIKTALFSQQKKFAPNSPGRNESEVIERQVVRLERIVNDFLQFARPAKPELVSVPAETPLKEAQALLSSQLEKADIRLLREDHNSLRIRADSGQIQQVLINLIQNAADSIGRGGTICLRARSDRKRLAGKEADVVVLEVADTGKGIPPEVEKRLFDPFFTTKDNGTGLGLSIAARIVELNGGALQYQTQVNHGSTFGIVLPRVL
jgi:signal transduction histidine kinase